MYKCKFLKDYYIASSESSAITISKPPKSYKACQFLLGDIYSEELH